MLIEVHFGFIAVLSFGLPGPAEKQPAPVF
jgi:hypothetical protein